MIENLNNVKENLANLKSKTMGEYVASLKKMQDNHSHGDLAGKVVLDLATADATIHQAILQAGAARCYVLGEIAGPVKDSRLVQVKGNPWDVDLTDVDVVFFDARAMPGLDGVDDVARMMAHLKTVMKPSGLIFAVLKNGVVNYGFDVFNAVAQTPSGPLPSQDFLFNEILRDYTIRILDRLPAENLAEVVRFFRLAIKKPTLVLILGSSHSGKTTLAREFASLGRHVHFSNDYIYWELIASKKKGFATAFPAKIMEKVGEGGGKACGEFNRALESDAELLKEYLGLIESVLPKSKNFITMDWDLMNEDHIAIAKDHFTKAGFSVWVLRRETDNCAAKLAAEQKVSEDLRNQLKQMQATLSQGRDAVKTSNAERSDEALVMQKNELETLQKKLQEREAAFNEDRKLLETLKREREETKALAEKQGKALQQLKNNWWVKLGNGTGLVSVDDNRT